MPAPAMTTSDCFGSSSEFIADAVSHCRWVT
jgi:hypothetical protein